jgi:hypothetical protein
VHIGDIAAHSRGSPWPSTYAFEAAGRQVPLADLNNDVHLHRLDIDDVIVTREDGTSFTTAGTYVLNFGGKKIAGPFNTKTGLDLLPGTYEVVVSYTTALGPQTKTYPITF